MADGTVPPGGFDLSYLGTPPWEIGRPQADLKAALDSSGALGSVLEIGCGSGEHSLYLASLGARPLGIDSSPRAIALARAKANARGLEATFRVHDALELGSLGRSFDTIVDCGLFHAFGDADRVHYVRSLNSASHPGTRLFLLCFSDQEPDPMGPRHVSEAELRETFRHGWTFVQLLPARFETRIHAAGYAHAWLAILERQSAGAG
jgi:cyclopropane fatty-acyl-phospholipid synthase-like methyltransferase